MVGLQSWAATLPALRLTTKEIADAWGACAARGLLRKAVCAFGEDPVTLAVTAANACIQSAGAPKQIELSAIFVGATTLPFDEKPSSSSIASYVSDSPLVRVTEIRGSPQAGLQALASAHEFCVQTGVSDRNRRSARPSGT
jgi:3-hydroxy-3-methylglutaryl CoA synthase